MFHQEIPSFYGYRPTSWITNGFLAIFSISTVIHICQAFLKPRTYWLLPTIVVCGIGETAGWATRLWNTEYPEDFAPFMIQRLMTIIAPIYLSAALYTILSRVIKQLGWQYSRLGAKAYLSMFVAIDVLALGVQVFGAGIAASANANHERSGLVSRIMAAGIFLHMAGIILFASLATEFMIRFHFQRPLISKVPLQFPPESGDDSDTESIIKSEKYLLYESGTNDSILPLEHKKKGKMPSPIQRMAIALLTCAILLFIRTVYRAIEFLDGWDGRIAKTELYFLLLDATPIALALLILNVWSPCFLLRDSVAK